MTTDLLGVTADEHRIGVGAATAVLRVALDEGRDVHEAAALVINAYRFAIVGTRIPIEAPHE